MEDNMSGKLRTYFDEMVVYKDLKNSNFFSALSLPSFTRDWLLRKFEDEEGNFDLILSSGLFQRRMTGLQLKAGL